MQLLWCLCLGLLVCLPGCGGGPSVSSNYVTANQDHLATMTWQQTGNDLSGTWKTWTMPDNTTTQVPAPQSIPFSGQIEDQTATLTIGGSSLQATIHQKSLSLEGTNGSSQFQATTWYSVSQKQSSQLVTAFMRYADLRGKLNALAQSVAHPDTSSDPYAFANSVQNAQTIVGTMQERAAELRSLGNPCGTGLLALFRAQSPTDETFVLSPYDQPAQTPDANAEATASHSQLALQLQDAQNAGLVVQNTAIPSISGLSQEWVLSPGDFGKAVQPGRDSLATLQQVLVNDYTTMKSLRQQAKLLIQEVNASAQIHGC